MTVLGTAPSGAGERSSPGAGEPVLPKAPPLRTSGRLRGRGTGGACVCVYRTLKTTAANPSP